MVLEIETENTPVYRFYPVSSEALKFSVKAPSDAHVALTTGPTEANPMYEIFIGGWQNTKSAIRKNRDKPDVMERETPQILAGNEYRNFWITFYNKTIAVGLDDDNTPLMSWSDPDLFRVTHFGVRTHWGATGSWKIEDTWGGWHAPPDTNSIGWRIEGVPMSGPGFWVPVTGGEVPPNAVPGGFDNEQLFIGRARHAGAQIPGKVQPSHGVCYIPWGGSEHGIKEYEVLCDFNGHWVAATGSNVPENAFPGGVAEDGEPLFIGRAHHNDTVTLGKVQKSHGVCYIPYGGQEIGIPEYEVLVAN